MANCLIELVVDMLFHCLTALEFERTVTKNRFHSQTKPLGQRCVWFVAFLSDRQRAHTLDCDTGESDTFCPVPKKGGAPIKF